MTSSAPKEPSLNPLHVADRQQTLLEAIAGKMEADVSIRFTSRTVSKLDHISLRLVVRKVSIRFTSRTVSKPAERHDRRLYRRGVSIRFTSRTVSKRRVILRRVRRH